MHEKMGQVGTTGDAHSLHGVGGAGSRGEYSIYQTVETSGEQTEILRDINHAKPAFSSQDLQDNLLPCYLGWGLEKVWKHRGMQGSWQRDQGSYLEQACRGRGGGEYRASSSTGDLQPEQGWGAGFGHSLWGDRKRKSVIPARGVAVLVLIGCKGDAGEGPPKNSYSRRELGGVREKLARSASLIRGGPSIN